LRNYQDLQVWTKAHALTLELYRLSRAFPREEMYGITSQLRRAAASIGANLAEGCGRQTDNELARFVRIALGSATELDYHLVLCRDLELLNKQQYETVAKELTSVRKMLVALLNAIESRDQKRAKATGAN